MCETIAINEGYPRSFSLVRLIDTSGETLNPDAVRLSQDEMFIFLGEIPNMPGHCVVADYTTGQIHAGCHTGSFIEIAISKMGSHTHASLNAHAITGEHQSHL